MSKCGSFFQVSRSGYYAYLKVRVERKRQEKSLKARVKEMFEESGGSYGPTRIVGVLRRSGEKASYHKISRLMAEMGLFSIHNRYLLTKLDEQQEIARVEFAESTTRKAFQRSVSSGL